MPSDPVLTAAGAAAALAGVLTLHRAWRLGGGGRLAWRLWAGWAALGLSLILFALASGFDAGTAIGICLAGVLAYAVIAAGLDRRNGKRTGPARAALEPQPRAGRPLRGFARFLIAGPLAAASAFAVSVALAVHLPGAPIDRLAAAAYLLPLLWGGAMAWGAADERLVRPGAGLAAFAACAWALSVFVEMRP